MLALYVAMSAGPSSPETSAAFTTAPVVALYSPIVLLKAFVTKITSARGGDRQRAEQDGKQRAQPAPQPQLHFLSLTRRLLRRFSTDTVARIAPLTKRIKGPKGLFTTDTVEKLGWRAFLGSTEAFPAKPVSGELPRATTVEPSQSSSLGDGSCPVSVRSCAPACASALPAIARRSMFGLDLTDDETAKQDLGELGRLGADYET